MDEGDPALRAAVRALPRAACAVPAVFLYVAVLGGGLALALARAAGWYPALGFTEPSTAGVRAALSDARFLPSVAFTFGTAIASTLLSVPAGALLAAFVAEALPSHALGRAFHAVGRISLATPHLVVANATLLLLDQGGFLSRLFAAAGLVDSTDAFPALVNDPAGIGVTAGFVLKETAFVAVLVFPSALRARRLFSGAAASLGAGPLRRALRVTLPVAGPSIAAATVIVLAYGLCAVEIPLVLGATSPRTLSVWAMESVGSVDPGEKMLAFALGAVNLAASAALLVAWGAVVARARRLEAHRPEARAGGGTS